MIEFNAILDAAPVKLEYWSGVIEKTDFRQVLKFFRLLADDALTEKEKAEKTIGLFFDGEPPDDPELFNKIMDFIACGKEREAAKEKRVFDYNADSGRIFAAFWQAYNIDLRTEKMHWFVFCELLSALPDDTRLMQVIDIRGKKPGKNDSDEYKKQLRKMQRAYKIEDDNDALESFFDRW